MRAGSLQPNPTTVSLVVRDELSKLSAIPLLKILICQKLFLKKFRKKFSKIVILDEMGNYLSFKLKQSMIDLIYPTVLVWQADTAEMILGEREKEKDSISIS